VKIRVCLRRKISPSGREVKILILDLPVSEGNVLPNSREVLREVRKEHANWQVIGWSKDN
jgi:hypothetical protein